MTRTAEEIAEKMREDTYWDNEDATELCELAGLTDEWNNADGDEFENLIYKAADKLGVVVF